MFLLTQMYDKYILEDFFYSNPWHFITIYLFIYLFWDRVFYVDQVSLDLWFHISASLVLELQPCTQKSKYFILPLSKMLYKHVNWAVNPGASKHTIG